MSASLSLIAALVLTLLPSRSHAQINVLPRELEGVGVTEHLNQPIALDATFRDHTGRSVRLAELFDGRRPVVLNLVYNRCPMLCNLVLHALVKGLRETEWTAGEQYDVVTVSIDPTDTPADLARRRDTLLRAYGRGSAAHGWHFLVGDPNSIRRLADSVGFQYRYDARQDQYAHPAVIFLLTPAGRVARYLYGLEYHASDLRLGLLEASEGRAISTVERVLLFCYHYDPQGKKYVLVATRVMQIGGAITALALGGFLAAMWRRERRRRGTDRDGDGSASGPRPDPRNTALLTPPRDAQS